MNARRRAPSTWTADERARVVAEHATARRMLDEVAVLAERADPDARRRLRHHREAALQRLARARATYLDAIPSVPLSRCPVTEEPVRYRLDTGGLDGPFWAFDGPVRPVQELPDSILTVTGAVALGAPPTPAPFLARPGPEVPYVVPRLLEHPDVAATISSVPVGAHTGYAIVYGADPRPDDLALANEWGTDRYLLPEGDWSRVDEDPDAWDFDLGTWIDAGKLAWIAPGDDRRRLHRTRDDCPYLDLPGRREPLRIQHGRTWTLSDITGGR